MTVLFFVGFFVFYDYFEANYVVCPQSLYSFLSSLRSQAQKKLTLFGMWDVNLSKCKGWCWEKTKERVCGLI